MFGCHNCDRRPEPGTPYEKTACADCKMKKETPPVSKYCDDPGTFHQLQVQHPSMEDDSSEVCGAADLNHLLQALGRSVRLLVKLKEKHPQTYRILDAKLADPNLSYTELAERFRCRKQNVQYHLKKAVELCPELSSALLIDSRFSCGYNALRTTARYSAGVSL